MDLWIILSSVSLLTLLYFYVHQKYSYWSKRGIPGPKPSLLSFGNYGSMLSQDPYKLEQDFRKKYGKMYGNYRFFKPVIAVADAALVKQVMVKDFHLFVDQQQLHLTHSIVSRIVFMENGLNWKRLRTITTPCFSSAKLRLMFSQMDQSVDQLAAHLDRLVRKENGLISDLKLMMVGFTLDVLASNVFGVQTNSNNEQDRNLSNPFMANALKIAHLSPLKLVSLFTLPSWLNHQIGFNKPMNDEAWEFFEKLAREILRQRRSKQAGKRNDLIEILINAHADENKFENGTSSYDKLDANLNTEEQTSPGYRTTKSVLTEEEIIAQAIGFMIGGYDSVAVALTFCVYELALNATVQERLQDALEQVLSDKKVNSSEYNEAVMQIPYLDAVIKEALRKYPPFTRIGRRFAGSAQPYKLGSTGVALEKGQLVEFPTFALHYDPEYFPEPNRFLPDRFMPENKAKLVPYSYIPFGHGPRNCIGLRFATQEMKLCLAKICRQFRFEPTNQTPASPIPFLPFKAQLVSPQIKVKVEKR